ncbi:MAG: ECF transporter S component [Acutalibacteraceae bacterium]
MQKKSLTLKIVSVLFFLVLAPVCVLVCSRLFSAGNYYISAVLLIVLSIIPFFIYFENRKIKTSEIAVLAVMTALCVASRALFAFLPQVKPMCALVIITAIAFGPNLGFVVGALSVFVSNFIFGQGMFTPFQMLGMGLTAFFCSLIFYKKRFAYSRFAVSIVGALLCFAVYGFIVDSCSVLMMLTEYTPKSVLTVYLSGMPFNLIHALTTGIVLLLLYKPMNDKLSRLRIKYGIFDIKER